ncbi:MAG: ATP-dependent zinc metalloprotease FtsH [Candidatus Saccharimonadales bacterium]|nr:ATP-dependent zinc metalloprotease FtsH [Candidatus Saccharimonadales bacterium]
MDNSRKKNSRNQRGMKNAGFIAILIVFALIVVALTQNPTELEEVSLSSVIDRANKGEIAQITQEGNNLEITLAGEEEATQKSFLPADIDLLQQIDTTKVEYTPKAENDTGGVIFQLAISFLPVIVIVGFLIFMMRQAQGQGNQAMTFGKSRARLFGNEKQKIKFKEVAGNIEAKEDLEEVVDFLKHPKKFQAVGAKIPKGVLLVGPPGTGKTMLARAVAGEAQVPFFTISGSEFVEMFVGVGASRVRDLFSKAKKNAPCIIFIDEIDAVGRRRGSGMGGGHDEREQTLNQILVEMDGFEQGTNVIVLAATNRSDVLDPALLRPGRFDRRVNIALPDRKDRKAILKVHMEDKPAEKNVDLEMLAGKTAGTSGADLANIVNESAIIAARNNRKTITNDDVTEAFEKVAIGPERKGKVMNEHEKELTAYHEAGHAVVGHVLPDSDVVHKVTIIPRGGTGGVTWFIPPEDKSYHSVVEYKDILARMLGGRVAEKIVYGKDQVTTGAGNDLQKATELAREMVIEQGMGESLRDQVFHDTNVGLMFERMTHERPYSDDTARLIDTEVEKLMKEAAKRAELVIRANLSGLEKLKNALIKHETIEADEVVKLLKDSKLPTGAKLYLGSKSKAKAK